VTFYSSTCELCDRLVEWVSDSNGGYWKHCHYQYSNVHDAQVDWYPPETISEKGWVTL
jgi:hypothetical protein